MARPTNTQFALAVHLLTLLGGSPDTVLNSEVLADSAGASAVHVRRILGRLRGAGIVTSRPGVGGGWVLNGCPDEITLADVWRVVQGDDRVLGLHGASPDCPVGQRIQRSLVAIDRRAARAVEDELRGITLGTLVGETTAGQLTDLIASR
jgi:Rrf2 family protein